MTYCLKKEESFFFDAELLSLRHNTRVQFGADRTWGLKLHQPRFNFFRYKLHLQIILSANLQRFVFDTLISYGLFNVSYFCVQLCRHYYFRNKIAVLKL